MSETPTTSLTDRLHRIVETMRTTADRLKSGEGYAYQELQPERNASAHSIEFWARRIEKELIEETNS